MDETSLIDVIVAHKRWEATDIFSYELVHVNGGKLPVFTAGAHIDVHLPGGLIRQYSLINSPGESERYLIAVLRERASRGGSIAMHDVVQEGNRLRISAPRNHFPLVEKSGSSLLFAGGIGITPMLCMAQRLSQLDADFTLHYCARSSDRAAFRTHALASGFIDRMQFHFDDGEDEQKLQLHVTLADPRPDAHLYICGPGGFIEYVIGVAREQGWREDQIHREYFTADPAAVKDGDAFQIKIASTGEIITVNEEQTVVEVLENAGIKIMTSCEQGVCGTCLTQVLAGELIHRDMFMTDKERAEGKYFTPCCSRGKGIVILGL